MPRPPRWLVSIPVMTEPLRCRSVPYFPPSTVPFFILYITSPCNPISPVALLTDLKEKWAKTVVEVEEAEDTEMASLTDPLLDHKLQAIIDEESSKEETPTRLMLLNLVQHTRTILNEGISLPLLIELSQMIKGRR